MSNDKLRKLTLWDCINWYAAAHGTEHEREQRKVLDQAIDAALADTADDTVTRIAELEEALRPFAKLADEIDGNDSDYVPCSMLCADFNRARKVLEG